MQKITILSVSICNIKMSEAIEEIRKMLKDGKQHYFVTPNPEIILKAQKDKQYLKILNNADLQTADGAGVLWAAKRQGNPLPEKVTGVELMQKICELAEKSNDKIFLLGAGEGVANLTKEKLQERFKNLKISGTYAGSPKQKDADLITKMINKSGASILFVAYGAPAQEKWIAENIKNMPNIKLAGGIGGAFDFVAGKKKRAPKWMQQLNLEWLFRLIIQPTRIKRIYNATIRFPMTVLRNK